MRLKPTATSSPWATLLAGIILTAFPIGSGILMALDRPNSRIIAIAAPALMAFAGMGMWKLGRCAVLMSRRRGSRPELVYLASPIIGKNLEIEIDHPVAFADDPRFMLSLACVRTVVNLEYDLEHVIEHGLWRTTCSPTLHPHPEHSRRSAIRAQIPLPEGLPPSGDGIRWILQCIHRRRLCSDTDSFMLQVSAPENSSISIPKPHPSPPIFPPGFELEAGTDGANASWGSGSQIRAAVIAASITATASISATWLYLLSAWVLGSLAAGIAILAGFQLVARALGRVTVRAQNNQIMETRSILGVPYRKRGWRPQSASELDLVQAARIGGIGSHDRLVIRPHRQTIGRSIPEDASRTVIEALRAQINQGE